LKHFDVLCKMIFQKLAGQKLLVSEPSPFRSRPTTFKHIFKYLYFNLIFLIWCFLIQVCTFHCYSSVNYVQLYFMQVAWNSTFWRRARIIVGNAPGGTGNVLQMCARHAAHYWTFDFSPACVVSTWFVTGNQLA